MANNNNNNNWKRIGGFSRTGTQNYVRTNDAAMGGTTFGSTDVSNNVGNTTLRIGNNAGVIYINGDIDMSGGANVVVPINRIRNVRDPIEDHDVATKFYVDERVGAIAIAGDIAKGPTGPEGPPGIGIAGTNGSAGPIGNTGPTGPLGATGSSFGVKGPTGDRGGTGSTGANGAAGATGPIGPAGEKGEQGTQGTQGIQGSNGTILWLNPDGDSPTNQLITDSYLLSKVPINASVRTVGPISVSATYGNVNKIIPASRFFNTAIEVSTLAVIPSGVWVLNLYANVPSNSDANQVALYAAVFMISGTTNQPSPDSLVIETKDGGDAGYYPPRAAYLPDHVKYIGKSWASTENVLTSNTDTANKGTFLEGTSRKLYKVEMPVEFITLQDASGNRENVYVQLQIYIRNTKEANQTANVSLYFQTDATTNETTYSYLQTTFGAVGIQGIPGKTGSTGAKGDNGLIGPAGPAGATGSAGPTGIAGPVGPRGSQGPTGVTGPAGSSNSYGVQYAVQYRGNQSTGDSDNSGNFRGDTNFRYIPTGYINRLTDATAGSVVLNDLACNSLHSPVYIQDTSIAVGSGTTRPRTYIRGGELVNSGPSAEQSNYVVLASGTDTTNGSNSKIAASVNDITNGVKMIHDYGNKKVTFQLHNEDKASGTVGLQFDLNGATNLGNISAARDQFCIVNSSGAAGVGGITAAQLSASAHTSLNRMLHVRGNVMVGSDPGGVNAASNAMVLLNKSTTTPSTPMSGYPGIYHRQIANSTEATGLGGSTNSIATAGEGLGFISPNFITFQTGSTLQNNSIVINQAGVVSVTGPRTNLNSAVSVNKNFATVETHDNLAPIMDISGTLSVTTGTPDFGDVPRIKLISRGIASNSSIPSLTQSPASTSNEIRGVSSNASTSGFLRLSAQTPAHSCIDLVGLNTSTSAYNNAVRISTGGNERMIVNGSGNVGIGTNAPTAPLDVNGITRIRNNLLTNSKIFVGTTDTATNDGTEFGYDSTGFSIWNYRNSSMRFGTSNNERMRILADGKVGIGTNAPTAPLEVVGNAIVRNSVRIGSTTAPTVALDVTGATKVSTILSAQTGLILGDNTKTAMDTGTPTMNDPSTGCLLNLINTTGNAKPRLRFVGNNNNFDIGCSDDESFIWSKGDKNLGIATNNNRRMTITNTGNVGIGIQGPTSLLHVAGAAKITGDLDMTTTGKIVNLVIPTAAQDAATKGYVDGRFGNATISTATIGSTSDANVITNTYDSKLAIYHATAPKIYMSTSSSAVGGLLIGVDRDIRSYIVNRQSAGELAIMTEQNIPIVFKTNAANVPGTWGTNRMVITGQKGLVGIGTDNPRAPLEIGDFPANDTGYLGPKYVGIWGAGFISVNGTYYGDYDMSIFAPRYIGTSKGFILWSDARIKRDIVDLEDNESLIKLRKLQPKKFTIVSSNLLRGKDENKYGFIAQEVEEVLEHSVIKTKEIIPNFMVHIKLNKYTGYIDQPVDSSNNKTYYLLEYASLTPETYDINYKFNITGNHDISGNEYKTNTQEPASDQSGNQVFKLLFYSKTAEKYEVFTKKIINDKTLLIYSDKILDEDIYLLVGQEVDDFRVLDKDPIATITTAALQEVDRQQQADKARIAELENQVSNLEATVATQQSLINDILERLKKLEA
jgi:hypothetical protein